PLLKPAVAPVERSAGGVELLPVRPTLHAKKQLREAGVQTEQVPLLHRNPVALHDAHALIITDPAAHIAQVPPQIDEHPSTLDGLLRHLLDAKAPCFHPSKGRAGSRFCRIMWLRGPDYMLPAAPAVVVDNLGLPIAVGVEEAADMGKRVPLGRVLRVQKNG